MAVHETYENLSVQQYESVVLGKRIKRIIERKSDVDFYNYSRLLDMFKPSSFMLKRLV